MKTLCLFGLALCAALAVPALAAEPAYKIVDRIKVPDGGFDYATFDAAKGRILMARTDFTTVIDAKTGKVSQLNSGALGHMALPIPGTNLIVLPQRRGTIRIADTATDMMLAELPGGKNPDGATYDPVTKYVFVMNRESAEATVVDPVARKVVTTIPIGGSIEFTVSDGAGKVFANDESVGEIAVIDDPTRKLAFITCGRDGVLEVTSLADPAHISVVQHLATQAGSRTGMV